MAVTENHRRIGDMTADTFVIAEHPRRRSALPRAVELHRGGV